MKNIAIITARGGSKRIPRKNIKDFLGRPIIAYSIEAAITSNLFDEVMVSTDDDEIAEIARQYGAKVPFLRSTENSNDFATTVEVIREVLEQYRQKGKLYKYGCCIYPTAPFVNGELLQKSYHLLNEKDYDSVFPVVKYSNPIQRALLVGENGKIAMMHPEYIASRSQDLEKTYYDSGQFYWFNIEKILAQKKLWTSNSGAIELLEHQVQDIDNPIDWKLAELKYKLLLEEKT
jgi:N-acylneuraminate cytidylyltransferase